MRIEYQAAIWNWLWVIRVFAEAQARVPCLLVPTLWNSHPLMLPIPLLAVASGLTFSLIAIAMRAAAGRGIDTLQAFLFLAIGGGLYFTGLEAWHMVNGIDQAPPWQVVALGALAGVTQYGSARFFRIAIRMGPLTPLWCAMLLGFLEPVAWSALVRGVPVTSGQWIAIACAVAAVVSSSRLAGTSGSPVVDRTTSHRGLYAALLVTVLLLNGVCNVCLKEVQDQGWGDSYVWALIALYIGVVIPAWIELRIASHRLRPWRQVLPWGVIGACGSVGGMSLLRLCLEGSAATVFTIQSASSIVGAAIAGIFIFRERASFAWWMTVFFVLAAVVAVAR